MEKGFTAATARQKFIAPQAKIYTIHGTKRCQINLSAPMKCAQPNQHREKWGQM
jgi:hypothetical protein